jgi:hypothetical protein
MNLAQFRREARKVMKKNPSDDAIAAVHKELARRKEGLTVSEVWGRRSDYVGKARSRVGDRKARSAAIDKRLKEERKAMKKNPKARRNHHLIVGERVKYSDEGLWNYQMIRALPLSAGPTATRGTVVREKEVVRLDGKTVDGYVVAWDKVMHRGRDFGDGETWVADRDVVAVNSTTRKWPGNNYEGVDPMTKKNPKARRNHHLIVGERVKLSDEGWDDLKHGVKFRGPWKKPWKEMTHAERKAWDAQSLGASDFRRSQTEILGDVVEVQSNGYFIRWDGESWDAWVPDRKVVSANSTTRKWPGDHYEGITPKKNPNYSYRREQRFAKRRREERKYPIGERVKVSPAIWARRGLTLIDPNYKRKMEQRRGVIEDFRRGRESRMGNPIYEYMILWDDNPEEERWPPIDIIAAEKGKSLNWPGNHYEGVDPMTKKNPKARRNMAIKRMPDGTILADTPKEMMEWMQLEAGSSFQQPTVEAPRLLKAGNLDGGYGARKLRGGKWAKLEELQASLPYSKPLSLTYSTLMKLIGGTKARHALAGGKPPKSIGNRAILVSHGVTPEMVKKFIALTAGKVPGLLTAKTSARGTAYFTLNQGLLDENPQLTPTLFTALQQATVGARKNPKLGASPTIGHAQYYRQPTNAGPYTPQTFPYGYGGRPATYKVAKENSNKYPSKKGTVFFDGIYFDNLIDLMEYRGRGAGYYAMMEARTGQDTSEAVKEDVRLTLQEWTPREQREIKALLKLGTRGGVWGLKAKKNSSARRMGRYAIQMEQDYPGWAQRGPIEANWTSDPTYAYEQFARANGSGPRGGYSSSERDALPAADFLDPKTRSWPVSDANHAKIAIQYMTRGFGNARTYPTLIRRLATMYPVTYQGNKAIWSKYNRLRSEIAEKAGKTMPTVNALKKFAPEQHFKAAANSGRRR